MWQYDVHAKNKMKIPIKRKKMTIFWNIIFNSTMITATVLIMVYYQKITYDDNAEISA